MIEARERNQQNRIKQLEKQIAIMREQLDNERRRRRDYADRTLACELGRLGNFSGLRSVNIHSAGLPPVDTSDLFSGRSANNQSLRIKKSITYKPLVLQRKKKE